MPDHIRTLISDPPIGRLIGTVRSSDPGGTGSGAVPPAATALLARMTTASSSRRQQIINAFKEAGDAIGNLDFWHMLNAEDESQAAMNWLENAFNLTKVGATAFTAGRGYQGGGTNALNTGYIPASAGRKMLQDDAAMGVLILAPYAPSAIGIEMGANSAGVASYIGTNAGLNNIFAGINSAAADNSITGLPPVLGLFTVVRRAAGSFDLYCGKLKIGTFTNASAPLPTAVLRYLSGSTTSYSARRIMAGFAGKALSDAQVAAMDAAIRADALATGAYMWDWHITCFGNSLTDGVGVSSKPVNAYPPQLQALYTAAGASVDVSRNGFPGHTSQQLSADLELDMLVRMACQFPAKKRLGVIWELRNDIALTGASDAQAVDNLKAAAQKLRLMGHDKIIVCNATADGSGSGMVPFTTSRQTSVNALLATRYTEFADALVDLAAVPELNDPNNATYFSGDKLHYVTAGYGVAAARIKPIADAVMAAA